MDFFFRVRTGTCERGSFEIESEIFDDAVVDRTQAMAQVIQQFQQRVGVFADVPAPDDELVFIQSIEIEFV